MKKILICAAFYAAVIVLSLSQGICACAEEIPEISAKAAVLISQDTKEIIFGENYGEKLPMASTTKIMTALLCLESGNTDEKFVVDSDAIKVEGSSMGLREGDIVTMHDLCCGMLLPSGNDAANAGAVRAAGSIDAFVKLMNQRAVEIGLERTFFATPSGLDGTGHGSSAYDMAVLACEALKNPDFREICSSEKISVCFGNPPYQRTLKNTNKLLSMYDGVYGIKTGFTDDAGRCLVSACERDGKKLVCVTLNDRDDWNDHIAMYDYGFEAARLENIPVPQMIEADLAGGCGSEKAVLSPQIQEIPVTEFSADREKYKFTVISPAFLYAPLEKGEKTAELRLEYDGREVCTVPLCAVQDYRISEEKSENLTIKEKIIRLLRSF